MKRRLIYALALATTPAMAQQVPTSTTVTPSPECMTQAVNDFRSAWQQATGNPYYDTLDVEPKNGLPDTIESTWAVHAAARGCTFRKASAPVAVPDPAALAAERARALSDARAALAGVR